MKHDQESWLVVLFDHFNKDPDVVSDGFETNFMTDVGERFSKEGVEMFVSPKMMNILKRIGTDRYDMDWNDYKEDE